ncbi:MAG TPA: hypothetical protein VNW90_04140 [Acetobacteraceae bacterium]|nr:hypothetical protein [Acetobacteraceae bacterium]
MTKPIDRSYISAPIAGTIYIAEYERRNSRKLRWSAMPAERAELDNLIDARRVPVCARQAAREFMA